MIENRKFGALSSSDDPQKLADTVKGLILTFSAIIMVVGTKLGLPLTENSIAVFAEQIGLAAGSLWFLYGLVKKAVVKFSQR